MNRLTNNDKNWGPFTLVRWKDRISAEIKSGDDEDPECTILFVGFGWAFRVRIPTILKPLPGWDGGERRYGFSLSKSEAGYDFFQLYYGPYTMDSRTTKCWSKHLPWKMWDHVRHSYYNPDGTLFGTDPQGRGKWEECDKIKQACPITEFEFEDYDGKRIKATCRIEEREWHRGEGWFKWMKYFYRAKIRRSLDLWFSEEVGPGKGSWKGGTIGTGCEMQDGDTPESAFRRFCEREHSHKGRDYRLKFIGLAE